MPRILVVPDLPLERWPSMDRYASRLVQQLNTQVATFEISVAGEIASLTNENGMAPGRRASGSGSRRLADEGGSAELRRYLSRYWMYPRRIRRMEGDVVHVLDHSYAHIVLGERKRPCVVTVHDLFPVITLRRTPGGVRDRMRNWLLTRVVSGIIQADAWIVATEWLREQLCEWLGLYDRVHVIPYGVDEAFLGAPQDDRALCRARWEIPESAFVILHVGSVDTRKNVPAIIAVLEQLRGEGMEAWFLQVGGSLTAEQQADLSSRGVAQYVTQLGPVVEVELRNAYHATDVLMFPSHYEGFGFPVLEAMASGLPVVTSGAGGLTEVAGDAAVIVPGRESQPYVEAIKQIAEDSEWRSELTRRGRERAVSFSWSQAATDTAKVYETLV
jgi:glycosyltransferase involved in cell wall biosynthesis